GIMLPGQLAAETLEEAQRRPGDYEAQVSQRPIAIHGLEHLSATDRGVTMFRKLVRAGIRAVRDGKDPMALCREPGAILPTFCNDTVVPVPEAESPVLDRQLQRATGRQLAEGYVRKPPLG